MTQNDWSRGTEIYSIKMICSKKRYLKWRFNPDFAWSLTILLVAPLEVLVEIEP